VAVQELIGYAMLSVALRSTVGSGGPRSQEVQAPHAMLVQSCRKCTTPTYGHNMQWINCFVSSAL